MSTANLNIAESKFWRYLRPIINCALGGFLFAMWLFATIVIYIGFSDPNSALNSVAAFAGVVIGIYLSRWVVVAALVVFLPGPALVRALFTFLLFSGEMLLVAILMEHSNEPVRFLTLPLVIFSLAVPFEMIRITRQAHIHVDWFDVVEPSKLGLRELFFRVTCFAVLCGILQFYGRDILLQMLGFALGNMIACSILILPLTMLLARSRYRKTLIATFIIGCILVSIALIAVLIGAELLPNSDIEDLIVFPIFIATLQVFYGFSWMLLGRLGLQFRMGRQT